MWQSEAVALAYQGAYYGAVFGGCYGVAFLAGAFIEGYQGATKAPNLGRIRQMIRQELPIHPHFTQNKPCT